MIIIGLTGSIGMGKSATAIMFRDQGIPVHDADAAVHTLYRGAAVPIIRNHFPRAIVEGAVDRAILGAEVFGKPDRLEILESLVHPLVEQDRREFIHEWEQKQARMIVVDIPLLFEIHAENSVDVIVVCSAPAQIQRERVLARPGMTPGKYESILGKQIPDKEKRARAHIVIDTGHGFDYARQQIRTLVRALPSY